MCVIRTYFPLDLAFKLLYMLKKHVFAFFARSHLCVSSFARKLLCRHSTSIAEVNSCINFNFCITIIMLYLSKNYKKFEIVILYVDVNVDKYVRLSIVFKR